jgi:hypothetical protein
LKEEIDKLKKEKNDGDAGGQQMQAHLIETINGHKLEIQ